MKRGSRISLLLATVLLIGLAGCSVLPTMDLGIELEPSFLQFTADYDPAEGLFFESESVQGTVYAKAGSVGGNLEGYIIEYYYSDGSPIIPGDYIDKSDALGTRVPAGLYCPGLEEGAPCTINTPGVAYAASKEQPFAALIPLPGQIGYQLFCDERSDVGAFARITFIARDDNGGHWEFVMPQVAIEADGSFLPPAFPRPVVCNP